LRSLKKGETIHTRIAFKTAKTGVDAGRTSNVWRRKRGRVASRDKRIKQTQLKEAGLASVYGSFKLKSQGVEGSSSTKH